MALAGPPASRPPAGGSKSTTISHLSQCVHARSSSPPCSRVRQTKTGLTAPTVSPVPSIATVTPGRRPHWSCWAKHASGGAERRLVDATQAQGLAEFAMLPQTQFRLAQGPVLAAHHTEQREELRLGELMRRVLGAIRRQHRPGDGDRVAREVHQADFRHRASRFSAVTDHLTRMPPKPTDS